LNRILIVISILLLGGAMGAFASEAPSQLPFELRHDARVAVLPVDNLAGTGAPLQDIRKSLIRKLRALGIRVIDDTTLAKSMFGHRIRYTGGVDTKMARIFRDEIKADALIVTSLELYMPDALPKIALTCRLVSTEPMPRIIWMESVGVTGDEEPGVLGMGLIHDPQKLQEKALRTLVKSLRSCLALHKAPAGAGRGNKVFRPKEIYTADVLPSAEKRTAAVIPFTNKSKRKNAGQIVLLHFVRELWGRGVRVMEPGVIRERMLAMRIIMSEGVSYRDMDLIAGEMEVDIFLSGKVFDYRDYQFVSTPPKVDFSAMAIQHKDRKVLWATNSYNSGDDPVHFFDIGRVSTASTMAAKMVQAIVTRIFAGI
jgi:hypothetical protein